MWIGKDELYDGGMAPFVSVAPCKHCGSGIANALTLSRQFCNSRCRQARYYQEHRRPGPTKADFPELFAMLEDENRKLEGRLIGYSLWFGTTRFPESGRVSRRDGVDGNIEFSDRPYWLFSQLPKVPKLAPNTAFRLLVWFRTHDNQLESRDVAFVSIRRQNLNTFVYDEQYRYFDPSGQYADLRRVEKWLKGTTRPRPPGAKTRTRRKREPICVNASPCVPAEPIPPPALPAHLEPMLSAITQRLDRLDARLDKAEPIEATSRLDPPPGLVSTIAQTQANLRKVQEELRAATQKMEQAAADQAKTEQALARVSAELAATKAEMQAEREARARTEETAAQKTDQAAADKAKTEQMLARKTAELADTQTALAQARAELNREREANLTKKVGPSPSASAKSAPKQHRTPAPAVQTMAKPAPASTPASAAQTSSGIGAKPTHPLRHAPSTEPGKTPVGMATSFTPQQQTPRPAMQPAARTTPPSSSPLAATQRIEAKAAASARKAPSTVPNPETKWKAQMGPNADLLLEHFRQQNIDTSKLTGQPPKKKPRKKW